jgi:hypothetical protein
MFRMSPTSFTVAKEMGKLNVENLYTACVSDGVLRYINGHEMSGGCRLSMLRDTIEGTSGSV